LREVGRVGEQWADLAPVSARSYNAHPLDLFALQCTEPEPGSRGYPASQKLLTAEAEVALVECRNGAKWKCRQLDDIAIPLGRCTRAGHANRPMGELEST
jgi:hypothetical protein